MKLSHNHFFIFSLLFAGSFSFASEKLPFKPDLKKVSVNPEDLDKVFPEELTFEQMGLLAKGETLSLSGFDLKAVAPEELYKKMPSSARQIGRGVLSLAGVADIAGAKLFGAIKTDGNIVVKSYKYTPSGVRPPFQFSVYYIAPGLPEGNKKIFEDVKSRDITENLKFSHGAAHPEVKKELLADKQSFIKQTQLNPVLENYAKYNSLYEKAFLAGDKITADYVRLLIKRIEAELLSIRMKLYFLDSTAPNMILANPALEVDLLLDTMDKTIVNNFYTREIQEEAQSFKAANKQHIETNLAKYEGKK